MSGVGYPKRPLVFRALNLAVHLAPLRRKYGHNSLLMYRPLDEADAEHVGAPNSVFRQAAPGDIERIAAHAEGLPLDVYRRRLALGDTCLCLFENDEILGFNWISRTSACVMRGFDTGMDFMPLGPEQAFSYDFYAWRSLRGRGVGREVKRAAIAALALAGVRDCYSIVMPQAGASLRIHAELGYKPLRLVYGYRLGPIAWTHLGPESDGPVLQRWLRGFLASDQTRGNKR